MVFIPLLATIIILCLFVFIIFVNIPKFNSIDKKDIKIRYISISIIEINIKNWNFIYFKGPLIKDPIIEFIKGPSGDIIIPSEKEIKKILLTLKYKEEDL